MGTQFKLREETFFTETERFHSPLSHATFNFVAIEKASGTYFLLQGRLVFSPNPLEELPQFRHDKILAGRHTLKDLNVAPREFLSTLLHGGVETDAGRVVFASSSTLLSEAVYAPLHPEGLLSRSRVSTFTVPGIVRAEVITQPDTDWRLKSASTPFDNLQELMTEYGVGPLTAEFTQVQLEAHASVAVDLSLRVQGEKADLGFLLAKGLDTNKASLGYRVVSNNAVVTRSVVAGREMKWSENELHLRGLKQISVPSAAVIQCYASYDGIAQNEGWIADPINVQNARRAVYQTFDTKLEVIQDYLTRDQGKGNSRDVEDGVSWLSWMLGFSPAALGYNPRASDAPDLLVCSPNGNVAVVECTTALLPGDKLVQLLSRTVQVKQRLAKSGNSHLTVIPVMVTTRTRDEVKANLEQAERQGVLVVTQEVLLKSLNRTLVVPDAEQMFSEGVAAITAARSKYSQ
ncbi:hypothetical protein [Ensifer sp. BR816]|uniref:hypothetical protein n=1 Tax=Rhizobium sp. (strain BR816) TaxID=1057002 RepID=UPI00035FDE62|nr:hypothetical protein [Ensifer sp. BR816]